MRYGKLFWVGALVLAMSGISMPTASALGFKAIQGPSAISVTTPVKKHRRPHHRRRHHRRHHRKVTSTVLHAPKV